MKIRAVKIPESVALRIADEMERRLVRGHRGEAPIIRSSAVGEVEHVTITLPRR